MLTLHDVSTQTGLRGPELWEALDSGSLRRLVHEGRCPVCNDAPYDDDAVDGVCSNCLGELCCTLHACDDPYCDCDGCIACHAAEYNPFVRHQSCLTCVDPLMQAMARRAADEGAPLSTVARQLMDGSLLLSIHPSRGEAA